MWSKEEKLLELENLRYDLEQNYKIIFLSDKEYIKDNTFLTNGYKRRVFLMNYSRLLHNYVASFSALYNNSIAIKNIIGNKDFEKEFESQRKMCLTHEVSFIRDLRNYTQHSKLPMAGVGVDFMYNSEGLTSKQPNHIWKHLPSLLLEDLLKYNKWTATSKLFLEGNLRVLEISLFLTLAHKRLLKFHFWIYERLKEL